MIQIILAGIGIAPHKPLLNKSIWRVRYNHRDSLKLADYMYSAGGPNLSRKRILFEQAAQQRPLRRTA